MAQQLEDRRSLHPPTYIRRMGSKLENNCTGRTRSHTAFASGYHGFDLGQPRRSSTGKLLKRTRLSCTELQHCRTQYKLSPNLTQTCPNPKKGKDMSKVRCYKCQELGHYANKCPNDGNNDNKISFLATRRSVFSKTCGAPLRDSTSQQARLCARTCKPTAGGCGYHFRRFGSGR